MIETFAILIALPIICLLGLGVIPSSLLNSKVKNTRQLVMYALGFQCITTSLLLVEILTLGGAPFIISIPGLTWDNGIGLGAYVDGITSLMLVMVSLVGFVVSRFSIRYLDGEAMQGRYFRWLGFTVGAVSTMVVSGNLAMFFGAWVMTSFGLHQLLLHYRHRSAAHRAAWTKFTISRLGDAFLIAALMLTFKTFGTFEFEVLFQKARELAESGQATAGQVAIGWFIILGAITKSAQFPFHTWLPDTMETPTPVSALMHAGVVNAGGYLVIRMSNLVALAPEAMVTLAAVGAFTACFGGIIMMTQPSVKRALAYSTIAQMGFMMLQCGMGAFTAAMVHLLAHSFYKAHAFLTTGSVISQSQATSTPPTAIRPGFANGWLVFASAALSIAVLLTACFVVGIDLASKPGGLVFAFILCLALTTWGGRLFAAGDRKAIWVAVAGIASLCLMYVASYACVHSVIHDSVPSIAASAWLQFIAFDVFLAFCALFLLHVVILHRRSPAWLEPLRVHAANGFYIDAIYQRVFRSLSRT